MTTTIRPGALAFMGPDHAPALDEFAYVRAKKVSRDSVTAVVVGPESAGDKTIDIPLSIFRARVVDASESKLWPGYYVGSPVAFVSTGGADAGQWAYGVAASYAAEAASTLFEIIGVDGTMHHLTFTAFTRLIKLDPLNYALQIGKGRNPIALNAAELLLKHDAVCAATSKKTSSLPTSVIALLTAPFQPDERVPLLRPRDLSVVWVRRQHIVSNQLLSGKRKRDSAMYDDPVASSADPAAPSAAPVAPTQAVQFEDNAGASSIFSDSSSADIEEIRRHNTPLRKRGRDLHPDTESDVDEPPRVRPASSRTDFRPSVIAQNAHGAVVHDRHKGTDAQNLLELMQTSPQSVQFIPLPPVLRGLYEFGFGTRGLMLMHCKRATEVARMEASAKGLNMTDFSEKNQLRAAPTVQSRADVADALRSLKQFALEFYNSDTHRLIDAAASFVDEYYGAPDSDANTWQLIAHWISTKFGAYRGLLVNGHAEDARRVRTEFSRTDEGFCRIQELRRAAPATEPSHHTRHRQHDRGNRNEKQRTPQLVLDQAKAIKGPDGRSLCMRHLSTVGCHGGKDGECWEPTRAHFRPKERLPDELRQHIHSTYRGLAPKFADL